MNRLCWLIGHKWDAASDCYYDVCSRCGACPYYNGDDDEDSWHVEKFWSMRWHLFGRWAMFRSWLRPCLVCGRRFDRHSDTCAPF